MPGLVAHAMPDLVALPIMAQGALRMRVLVVLAMMVLLAQTIVAQGALLIVVLVVLYMMAQGAPPMMAHRAPLIVVLVARAMPDLVDHVTQVQVEQEKIARKCASNIFI